MVLSLSIHTNGSPYRAYDVSNIRIIPIHISPHTILSSRHFRETPFCRFPSLSCFVSFPFSTHYLPFHFFSTLLEYSPINISSKFWIIEIALLSYRLLINDHEFIINYIFNIVPYKSQNPSEYGEQNPTWIVYKMDVVVVLKRNKLNYER